jgi:hypothetical protein
MRLTGAADGEASAEGSPLADARRRLGRLPALTVVTVTYAALAPITLLVDNPARRIAGSILLALLVLHCLARPAGGWRVFFLAGVACMTCTILDDILALPREVGLGFGPFAVLLAWYEDHPDEDDGADRG